MTDRDKIANVLNSTEISQELSKEDIYKFADALIEARIGDVRELKKHRVVVEKSLIPEDDNAYVLPNTPIRVKQLYSGEEVEQIVKERDEYKHRAEVAERALLTTCVKLIEDEVDDVNAELLARVVYTKALRKARKEVAEGKKE